MALLSTEGRDGIATLLPKNDEQVLPGRSWKACVLYKEFSVWGFSANHSLSSGHQSDLFLERGKGTRQRACLELV